MDRYAAQSRPPTRRKPLGDATSRANSATPPPQRLKKRQLVSSSPAPLPHNESFVGNGKLTVRNGLDSPEHPRISAIANDEQADSKRLSAISTTSTNASNAGPRRKSHIGPWQLGRTIGKGGCSRVRAVRHAYTNQLGAAKIISKSVAEKARAISLANLIASAEHDPSMLAGGRVIPFGLEREIVIMKLLNHRNIVRLYDVWENRNELYLIMEFVKGGELFHYIEESGGLDEGQVVYLFRQIIAALLYCHRIHIHHRDLKPENILLDRHNWEIKLVDFGMAALQPQGKYLSTPCGSPHYAAPEVLSRKSYDGGQADVWSCGVILYIMLTGLLPFNCDADPRLDEGRKMRSLYAAICNADYEMPTELSTEAKDLIRAIFVPEPKRRITIEGIWNHPFLHKYDADFGYESTHMDHWIGPRPQIEDWKSLRREDIDREILRNMRTLWHSEKEETLIQRLLSDEPNHEKFFYSALLRHREEHLENYSGSPGGVGYSASDHQPLMSPGDSKDMPPLPTSSQVRSKSAYSIMNDEHLKSRHSFYEHPPSEGSYDPFRASKNPIVNSSVDYMNVTVHRGNSSGSRRRKTGLRNSQRHPDSLRVEALKRGNRRSSGISGTSVSLKGSPAQRSSVALRSSTSRLSTRSSLWPSSPPGMMRPNSMHKRTVNFSHLRRSSTASGLTDGPQYTPEQRKFLFRSHRESAEPLPALPSSPVVQAHNIMRSRKENLTLRPPQLPVRNSRSPTRCIENEARKVSTELNKLCEEAFNRSSVGSSIRTSVTDKPNPYDTPPSSVSKISSFSGPKVQTLQNDVFDSRPLPPLPIETPTTFTARELAETRRRLAAKYAEEGKDNAAYFKEVLEHLDSLMPSSSQPVTYDSRRIASAPAPKSPDDQGYLPVISEEGRFSDADELQPMNERNRSSYRAVTDPFGRKPILPGRRHGEQNTIRMVDPSSPTPIAPLNIRKASGTSTATQHAKSRITRQQPGEDGTLNAVGTAEASRKSGKDFLIALDPDLEREGATTPNISTTTNAKKDIKPPPRKKASWFRRKTNDDKESKDAKSKIPGAWRDLDDRVKSQPPRAAKHSKDNSDPTSSSSEFPMRRPAPATAAKKSLWKMFGKKSAAAKREGMGLRLGSSTDLSTSSLMSGFDLASTDSHDASARAAEATTQTNWLARFLHIKPASKILCFQVGRGRARAEVVRLLREWRRFGVRDVVFDRAANTVTARVDKVNHLKIKPVSFTAELFVMLEHGRRAQLCVARFTQTRGAASSFRRVVDIVEEVCAAKGLLVEHGERWRAMCEVLG